MNKLFIVLAFSIVMIAYCAFLIFSKRESEERFLIKNIEYFEQVRDVIVDNRSVAHIQRGVPAKAEYLPRYGVISDEDIEVYEKVLEIMGKIDVYSVRVWRSSEDGGLISISFFLVPSAKVSGSGSVAIEYFANADDVEKSHNSDDICSAVDEVKSNWFVCVLQ